MEKVKLSETAEAITELAQGEFKEVQIKELRNVFKEVSWGVIKIRVADGNIDTIEISKTYKPVVDKL